MKRIQRKDEKEYDEMNLGSLEPTLNSIWFICLISLVFISIQIITFKENIVVNANGDIHPQNLGFLLFPFQVEMYSQDFYSMSKIISVICFIYLLCFFPLIAKYCNYILQVIMMTTLSYAIILSLVGAVITYSSNETPVLNTQVEVSIKEQGTKIDNLSIVKTSKSDLLQVITSIQGENGVELDKNKEYYLSIVKSDNDVVKLYYSGGKLDNISDVKYIGEADETNKNFVNLLINEKSDEKGFLSLLIGEESDE